MKNDFQTQLDQYNTNIDNKIDNAIASYLYGIKIDAAPTVLWDRLRNQMGDVWISNNFEVGDNDVTTKTKIESRRHFTFKVYDNIKQTIYLQLSESWKYGPSNQYCFSSNPSNFGTGTLLWWWNLEYSPRQNVYSGGNTILGSYCSGNSPETGQFFTDEDKTLNTKSYVFRTDTVWPAIGWNRGGWSSSRYIDELTTATKNVSKSVHFDSNGAGSFYDYYINPSGKKVLRKYNVSAYPVYDLLLIAHSYKSFECSDLDTFKMYYTNETGKSDATNLSYTVDNKSEFGSWNIGNMSNVQDGSTVTSAYAGKLSIYQIKVDDGKDYGIFLIGKNSDTDVNAVNITSGVTALSQQTISKDTTKTTYVENQCLITGQKGCDQNLSGTELKYNPIKLTTEQIKLSDFVNEYVSTVAEETTYLGGGIPIISVADDQRLRIKIKFKVRDSSGGATNGQVNYIMSDKQFDNCNVSSGATTYANGIIDAGTEETLEFDAKNGKVWINFYSTTDGYETSIDTIDAKNIN